MYNAGVEQINKAIDSSAYLEKAISSLSSAILALPESLLTRRTLGVAYLRNDDMKNAADQFTIFFEQGRHVVRQTSRRIFILTAETCSNRNLWTLIEWIFESIKNLANIHEKIKAADVSYLLGDSLIKVSKSLQSLRGAIRRKHGRIDKYHLTLSVEDGIVIMKYDDDKPYTPAIDSTPLQSLQLSSSIKLSLQ